MSDKVRRPDAPAPPAEPGRDEAEVSRFVESFAGVLAEAGWLRMPARVFATLIASDSYGLTAAELAGRLVVSPAAISGAVRYLRQLDMIVREREPGERRDIFRVRKDIWVYLVDRQMGVMLKWSDLLVTGLSAVGKDTPAGERLTETLDFLEFMRAEMPALMGRWRRSRAG